MINIKWAYLPTTNVSEVINDVVYRHDRLKSLSTVPWARVDSLRQTQKNRRHFAGDISKCIFLNKNVRISIDMSLEFVSMGPISKIPALVQIKWLGAVWNNDGWLTDTYMCDWAPISQTGRSFAVTEHGTILFRNRIFKFIATCVMANRLFYALFQYPSQKSNLYCEPYTQSERLRELYYHYHYYHCYSQCYYLLSLVLY